MWLALLLAAALPGEAALQDALREAVRAACRKTATHAADLAPFPTRVAPGSELDVSGTLVSGLSQPRVFVAGPSGIAERTVQVSGPRFSARVPIGGKGAYTIEVLA